MIRAWIGLILLSVSLMGCAREIVMSADDVMRLRNATLSRELGKDTFETESGVVIRIKR